MRRLRHRGTELEECVNAWNNPSGPSCAAWPLTTGHSRLCNGLSVCLFANEENLASLYYMRALTRGGGVGMGRET